MSKPEQKELPDTVTADVAMTTPSFVKFLRSPMRRWVMLVTADELRACGIVRVVDFYLHTPARIEEFPLSINARHELEEFLTARKEQIPRPLRLDAVVRELVGLPPGALTIGVRPHIMDHAAFAQEIERYSYLFN